MRDMVRMDGWLLDDGKVLFTDFNMVSGMEQNSFMFLQAAQIGMSHRDILRYILANACQRHDLKLGQQSVQISTKSREAVQVIFGGNSSERQVSLMSGTNVWLKLRQSARYCPKPFLLAPDHQVWALPYALTLRHTVEEVVDACEHAIESSVRLEKYRQKILSQLEADADYLSLKEFIPQKLSLEAFIQQASKVFIAIHGDIGENGVLQASLEKAGVPYTGSNAQTSQLALDKYATSKALALLVEQGIYTAPKKLLATEMLLNKSKADYERLWERTCEAFQSPTLIIKPQADGCSSGVLRLSQSTDLEKYMHYIQSDLPYIPANTFPD